MVNIFKYSNYRFFLKDWLAEKKATGNHLTYEALGEAAGFTSKGFLTQILQGKSNLPERMVDKIAKALLLGDEEQAYFSLLVQFNQAKVARKRAELHQKILSDFRVEAKSLALDQFEYYQKWYYSAIRSLLGYFPFRGDFTELGKQLEPVISAAKAKSAIRLLENLGLIAVKEDGYYHLTDRLITTGEDLTSHGIITFQREMMDMAKEALERIPKPQRSASTMTIGVSPKGYQDIEQRIRKLRQEVTEITKFDVGIDRVVQINLHAFPLTRLPGEMESE